MPIHKLRKPGFTLIELLMVIAIIGILAALIIVSLQGATNKAKDASRKSDIASINKAADMYKAENDSYPLSDGEFVNESDEVGKSLINKNYLKRIPTDRYGGGYFYKSDGSTYSTSICLLSEPTKCIRLSSISGITEITVQNIPPMWQTSGVSIVREANGVSIYAPLLYDSVGYIYKYKIQKDATTATCNIQKSYILVNDSSTCLGTPISILSGVSGTWTVTLSATNPLGKTTTLDSVSYTYNGSSPINANLPTYSVSSYITGRALFRINQIQTIKSYVVRYGIAGSGNYKYFNVANTGGFPGYYPAPHAGLDYLSTGIYEFSIATVDVNNIISAFNTYNPYGLYSIQNTNPTPDSSPPTIIDSARYMRAPFSAWGIVLPAINDNGMDNLDLSFVIKKKVGDNYQIIYSGSGFTKLDIQSGGTMINNMDTISQYYMDAIARDETGNVTTIHPNILMVNTSVVPTVVP